MMFERVRIAGLGYTLPDEIVTSDELEARLAPLYDRLRLPPGRLEQMTGIGQRRFWSREQPLAPISAQSGRAALHVANIEAEQIGALVHGSVCRDFLEPATACRVHDQLCLPADCLIYDVSNACLGLLNGVLQVAAMIELGHIRAGLVVGTENGRALVDDTVCKLNEDASLSRKTIKSSIASLTIGSASAAIVLCHESLAPDAARLLAASYRADTSHNALCQSDGLQTIMHTDSERLMQQGVATARRTFDAFLYKTDRTICHQVGAAHQRLLLDTLELDAQRDFTTFHWLGNTGSAALPTTLAVAVETGHIERGHRVALLGIGSGINCIMLATQW